VHNVYKVGFIYKITQILSCDAVVANERYEAGVSRWFVGLRHILIYAFKTGGGDIILVSFGIEFSKYLSLL
jgi:hypothetical protein